MAGYLPWWWRLFWTHKRIDDAKVTAIQASETCIDHTLFGILSILKNIIRRNWSRLNLAMCAYRGMDVHRRSPMNMLLRLDHAELEMYIFFTDRVPIAAGSLLLFPMCCGRRTVHQSLFCSIITNCEHNTVQLDVRKWSFGPCLRRGVVLHQVVITLHIKM